MGILTSDCVQICDRIQSDHGKLRALWVALCERVERHTAQPGLLQPDDNQEWWHLVMERLTDAAFVQAVRPTDRLGAWLRLVTLTICDKSAEDWIGPWYRSKQQPLTGALETAHIGVAVAAVYDLCPNLFDADERMKIAKALRFKCQQPCERYLQYAVSQRGHISNWFMVLLNGFGTVSATLDDGQAVLKAIDYFHVATTLYNANSYGESLQYSNYASLHLGYLTEILIRYDASLADQLDIGCIAKLMPWYAASLMYNKPLEGWGSAPLARSANFGDSSAFFRASGDVLLQVAARVKKAYPKEAGLARWLFETTYADAGILPTSRASFGFINHFQFFSLLLYKDAAPPLSPEQAELPLLSQSEVGNILIRDQWENPEIVLAIQGGFDKLAVTAHRHADQNSFILAYLQERFFADPGHCCYRLKSQAFSTSTRSHNTWSFLTEQDGKENHIEQRTVGGNIYRDTPYFNQLKMATEMDDIAVVVSDAADIYGTPVKKAERTWIAAKPHVLFIVDRIESEQPMKVQTHFVLNNRDNRLNVHEAAKTKLVFRRLPAAMKFFQVASQADGEDFACDLSYDWGTMHDCYHPLPNQKGQGAEGSALIYNYTSTKAAKSHTYIYVIAMDHNDHIKHWHIFNKEDGSYLAEPPEQAGGYSLRLESGGTIFVQNHTAGKSYTITETNFSEVK